MNKGVDKVKVSEAIRQMIDLMNELGMTNEEKAFAAGELARSAREVAMADDLGVDIPNRD